MNQDCNNSVIDSAALFTPAQVESLTKSGRELVNQGADLHVLTIDLGSAPTLDVAEKSFEDNCSTWKAPDGGRKNSLVVLSVAPKQRKTGLYYGGAWNDALNGKWMQITTRDMNPHFRDHDFVGGITAGEQQISKLITASRDETKRTTIVNEAPKPTDLSGAWSFLNALLFVAVIAAAVSLVLYAIVSRRKRKEASATAQRAAVSRRNLVADKLQSVLVKMTDHEAKGGANLDTVRSRFNAANDAYALLLNSPSMDPEQKGLTAGQYSNIESEYLRVAGLLEYVEQKIAWATMPVAQMPYISTPDRRQRRPVTPTSRPFIQQNYNSPGAHGDSSFLTGFVAGDILSGDAGSTAVPPAAKAEPEKHKSRSGSDTSSSWSGSSSSDGGSSSWGSSSDYGGSSDFGSSSGGGGSSDW
jgi:uncharacterized membrane protein YgcG